MDIDGTTEMFDLVHQVVRLVHGLANVRTACGYYASIKTMHTRAKVVTCLWCVGCKGKT